MIGMCGMGDLGKRPIPDMFPTPTGEPTAIERAGVEAAICGIWKIGKKHDDVLAWFEIQAMRRTLMCFGMAYHEAVEELAWLQWFIDAQQEGE